MSAVQVEEISSTSEPEVGKVVKPAVVVPRFERGNMICIPAERHQDPNMQEIYQKDFLRNLAGKVCGAAEMKSVAYQGCSKKQFIAINVCQVLVELRADPNIGMTTMRTTLIRDKIALPGMDYVFAASILFEYILSVYDYNLVFFSPKTDMLYPGYPTRQISPEVFCYDSTKDDVEQMLRRWMNHITNVRYVHIGDVHTEEQEAKCCDTFHQYFQFRVQGVQAGDVSYNMAEAFRQGVRTVAFNTDVFPPMVPLKWIMQWIFNNPEYNCLRELHFSHPTQAYGSHIFSYMHIKLGELINNAMVIETEDGRRCRIDVDDGDLHFYALDEEKVQDTMTVYHEPFGEDGLTDIKDLYETYVKLDLADSEATD